MDMRISSINDILGKRALPEGQRLQVGDQPSAIMASKKLKADISSSQKPNQAIPEQKSVDTRRQTTIMSTEDLSVHLEEKNFNPGSFTKENIENFLCFNLGLSFPTSFTF